VTFTQLTAQPYDYRDAVRFDNGREVLLQKLKPGQRAVVLRLALAEEVVDPEIVYAVCLRETSVKKAKKARSLSPPSGAPRRIAAVVNDAGKANR
jgi:hypothetical protein